MKKLSLFIASVALIGFTSCQKCTDCSCVYTDTFTFEDGFPADQEASIRTDYDNSTTYPDVTQEVCSKRGDFDAAVNTFESQSKTFQDDGARDGKAWSYDGTYTCTCGK